MMASSLAAPAQVASTRGLKAQRTAAPKAAARACLSVKADGTSIQFVKGTNETSVPDVRLTRSKDGTNGTAFFYFSEPDVFEADELSGEITGRVAKRCRGEGGNVEDVLFERECHGKAFFAHPPFPRTTSPVR